VCGIGYDRAAELGPAAARYHEIRRVVTNLCVLDFGGRDHRMRLRSVHAGFSVDDVVAATGFELEIPHDVDATPMPDDDDLRLIADIIDPGEQRYAEVKG
jgi:hypothetical protein